MKDLDPVEPGATASTTVQVLQPQKPIEGERRPMLRHELLTDAVWQVGQESPQTEESRISAECAWCGCTLNKLDMARSDVPGFWRCADSAACLRHQPTGPHAVALPRPSISAIDLVESGAVAAKARLEASREPAATTPVLASAQIDACLVIGSLEYAANEEYRKGRYDPQDGGPALARLNAARRAKAALDLPPVERESPQTPPSNALQQHNDVVLPFELVPFGFDPDPRALEKSDNGWVYCRKCEKPQPVSGHECEVKP